MMFTTEHDMTNTNQQSKYTIAKEEQMHKHLKRKVI